jgi:assimilatory nitrate reductase catalytic subunit
LRWDTLDQVIAAGPPKDGAPPVVMLCQPDTNAAAGPTVCACFDVGLNTVRDALRAGEVSTVEDIARQFKAGTNCGSCLPELKRITARERAAAKV